MGAGLQLIPAVHLSENLEEDQSGCAEGLYHNELRTSRFPLGASTVG